MTFKHHMPGQHIREGRRTPEYTDPPTPEYEAKSMFPEQQRIFDEDMLRSVFWNRPAHKGEHLNQSFNQAICRCVPNGEKRYKHHNPEWILNHHSDDSLQCRRDVPVHPIAGSSVR
jgi:hypothetical protein